MRRNLLATLAVVAAIVAGCAGRRLDVDLGLRVIGRAPGRLRRLLARARLHRVRGDGGDRREAVLRRLRRPRRADPPGRDPGRLRRRQHEPPRRPLRGRPGREAGRLRHEHAGARRARGLGDRLARRPHRPTSPWRSATRACRSATTPARCSAGCRRASPTRSSTTCARSSPTSRGSSASSLRARSTRASSTSPTSSPPTARSRRSTCRSDLQPDVAYGAAVVEGADNPEGAQAFIDGLLDGRRRDGARRRGLRAAARGLSRCATVAPSRSSWSSRWR